MADDKVDIVVRDKIDASINTKLTSITSNALKADTAINALNRALNSIRYSAVTALSSALSKVGSSANIVTTSTRNLSTALSNFTRIVESALAAANSHSLGLAKLLTAQDATVGSGRQMQAALVSAAEAMRAQAQAAKSLATSLEQATRARRDLNSASRQTIPALRNTTSTQVSVASNPGAGTALLGAEVAAPAALAASAFAKMQNATVSNNVALQQLVRTQTKNAALGYEQMAAANTYTAALNNQNGALARHQQFLAGTTRTWGVMLRWVAAYHVAIATVQSLDVSTNLNNKIRALVATTKEETQAISDAVYDVAERSRVSVEAVGTAFVRFDLALRNQGASIQESLRFTETFSKSLIIAGSSVSETTSALHQMSQAMNKGKADGDEFRTLMEVTPLVMDAVAKSMGLVGKSGEILRGKLLDLAPKGKITAQVLREAIGGMAADIDAKFKTMNLTIGQALTLASNRFTRWINDIQNSTGIVTQFANLIELLTRDISLLIETIIYAIAINYAFKAGFAINSGAALREATIKGIQKEIATNEALMLRATADEAKRVTIHTADMAMLAEKHIAEGVLIKDAEARLIAERATATANLKRIQGHADLITAGASSRAAPLMASVSAFKQEAVEKKKIAEEVYASSVAAAATQLNLAKSTAQAEIDVLQKSLSTRKGVVTKALNAEVAAKRKVEALMSAASAGEATAEVLAAKMRAEELYQNKIKDAPNLHNRYMRSLKEMEKMEAARTAAVLASTEALGAVPKAEAALEAAQAKVLSKELARSTVEQQMLVGKAKLTEAEVAHARAISAAELEKSRAYGLSEAAYVKAKAKQTEVDAVFTATQAKNAAAIAKVQQSNAASEAALLADISAKRRIASAEISAATAATQASAAALKSAQADTAIMTTAIATGQSNLAIAQTSMFARMWTGFKNLIGSILKFTFSLGGLVTAVLGGAAAFVIFSDKIKLYENNNGVTAADALTVAMRGLFSAVTGTPEPFAPIAESLDRVGISMMKSAKDVFKLMDIYSEAFNGNALLTISAAIITGLGVLTLNIGIYLGQALIELGFKIITWTISLGESLYNALSLIISWELELGKYLATAVWNGLKYVGGLVYDFGAYVVGIFSSLFSWVIDKITAVASSIKNFFVGLWKSVFGGENIDSTETREKLKSEIDKIGRDVRTDLNESIIQDTANWVNELVAIKTTDMFAGLEDASTVVIDLNRVSSQLPETFADVKNSVLSSADAIDQLKVAFQELSGITVQMPQIAADWKTTIDTSYENSFSNFEAAILEQAEKRKKKEVDLNKSRPGGPGAGSGDEKRSVSLAKINKELDDEISRFGMLGEARKIQEKMDHIEEKLLSKKITLTKEENAALLAKITLTVRNAAIQSEMDSIYNETVAQQQKYKDTATALNNLLAKQIITTNYYAQSMTELKIKSAELQLQMGNENWGDAILVSISKVTSGFKNMISGLSDSFGTFFSSLTDGFARSMSRAIAFSENLKDALLDVARNALAELMQALLKLQIQYLITKAIGGSLLGGDTGWLTKLIPGMAKGGYTGDSPINAVAGVVHGQEYVFDAKTTQRIGVDTLNALRTGRLNLPTKNSAANSNSPMNVSIANYGTSKTFSVEQVSLSEVRIIAQDEANKAVATKSERVVASKLSNPNSSISKALSRTTNVARKR